MHKVIQALKPVEFLTQDESHALFVKALVNNLYFIPSSCVLFTAHPSPMFHHKPDVNNDVLYNHSGDCASLYIASYIMRFIFYRALSFTV